MRPTELLDVSTISEKEIQTRWEEAYNRFETPEEEIKKFIGRLEKLGQREWRRDARTVEIFCGHGNGLRALERLGFTNLEGVDISAALLAKYSGRAKLYEADCRKLPFENESRDNIIVQGGLHHLPTLPGDLDQTFSEVRRVLKPTGVFVVVEPWQTPFLRLAHFLGEQAILRRLSNKFDAFHTMIHYEAETYLHWLAKGDVVSTLLRKHFIEIRAWKGWGKLYFVGKPVSRV